jgi:hypothetical protein
VTSYRPMRSRGSPHFDNICIVYSIIYLILGGFEWY